MVQQEGGKWKLPDEVAEELDEPTLTAVEFERRHRDTQAAYTKSQQEVKKQKAISDGLVDHMVNTATLHITPEQRQELDGLKKSDPDAWRTKLDEYEVESKNILSNKLKDIEKESSNKSELEVRTEKLQAFTESSGIALTDDVIANDLPPRFTKRLENGEITFDEFLNQAAEFLGKEKVIAGTENTDESEPNISSVAGGSEPTDTAKEGDFEQTYDNTVF